MLNARGPSVQLLRDLNRLNVTDPIGVEIPFERWLRNAAYLVSLRSGETAFFRDLAEEVTRRRPAAGNPALRLREAGEIPERILFTSDMVSIRILEGAKLVGLGTARLKVKQIENGVPRTHPSGAPVMALGTGWLIGPKHIITNHHVVRARAGGERPPDAGDFEMQAKATLVQFDYDLDGAEGTTIPVEALCAGDESLDYAVLELNRDSERSPLLLWPGPLALPSGSRMPVNIIQHPNGAAKQIAMRNNLAVLINDSSLAYFTDTDEGSSGSAVCNDQWQVVALHKSSDPTLGTFEYQGKTTAWINKGTRIDRIVDDLKLRHPAVWEKIVSQPCGKL